MDIADILHQLAASLTSQRQPIQPGQTPAGAPGGMIGGSQPLRDFSQHPWNRPFPAGTVGTGQ